jgi:hypothetical protein
VRERVGELAAAELGEAPWGWLHRAGQDHDLRLPARHSGGPQLNDPGEVVGILTIKDRTGDLTGEDTSFTHRADSLGPLLAAAGFNPRAA